MAIAVTVKIKEPKNGMCCSRVRWLSDFRNEVRFMIIAMSITNNVIDTTSDRTDLLYQVEC
jgi:hypothetical protein